jgi:hypothetical protein
MTTVEIKSETGDYAAEFNLSDILMLVEPFAKGLVWYLVEFDPVQLLGADGTPNTVPPVWVSSLWHEVEKGENRTKVDWQTLRAFARYVAQSNMALLIALDPGENLPPEPLDLNSPEFAIVIQCLDAYMWAITTQSTPLIQAIKSKFKDAEVVEKTQRYH